MQTQSLLTEPAEWESVCPLKVLTGLEDFHSLSGVQGLGAGIVTPSPGSCASSQSSSLGDLTPGYDLSVAACGERVTHRPFSMVFALWSEGEVGGLHGLWVPKHSCP